MSVILERGLHIGVEFGDFLRISIVLTIENPQRQMQVFGENVPERVAETYPSSSIAISEVSAASYGIFGL